MIRINKKNSLILMIMMLFFHANHGHCIQNPIFFFTGDGRYISFDSEEERIVDIGNLWKLGIYRVYDGKIDHVKKRLYLKSDYSVFVVNYNTMKLLKNFHAPYSPQDLINFFISNDGNRIVVSNLDVKTKKVYTTLYDLNNFEKIMELPCNAFSKNSHFIDSERIMCIETKKKKKYITIFSTKEHVIEKTIPFSEIEKDAPVKDRLIDIDSNNGKILFLTKHDYGTTKKRRFFLYDVLTGNSTNYINIPLKGDYRIGTETNMLFVNKIEYLPIKPNLRKRRKTGVFHLYSIADGKKISEITLPDEGISIGLGQSKTRFFYLNDWVLSEIAIPSNKIIKKTDLSNQMKKSRSNGIDFKCGKYNVSLSTD